jgi:ribosomal protein S27AE
MATPGTGEDIEDVCSRCGDVWHVVMAKVGERIARVVCKRCGSQHAYRSGSSSSESSTTTSTTTARRTTARRKKSPAPEPITAPTFDPSKPPRAYSPRDTYASSERIVHPTFGTGVVAATNPGPGKVDVVFPTGVRTLACAKTESTLERPTTVSNAPIGDRPPSSLK